MPNFWERARELLESPFKAGKKTVEDYPAIKKVSDLATKLAESGVDVGITPLGMTKGAMINKFLHPLRSSGRSASGYAKQPYIESGERFIESLPKKVVDFINDVRVEPGAISASYQETPQRLIRLSDPTIVPPGQYYKGLVHESSHAIQEALMRKDPSTYRRLADGLKAYEESLAEAMSNQLTKRPDLIHYKGAAEDLAQSLRESYIPGEKIKFGPNLLKWRIESQPYLSHRKAFDEALESSTNYELYRKIAYFLKALDQGWRLP